MFKFVNFMLDIFFRIVYDVDSSNSRTQYIVTGGELHGPTKVQLLQTAGQDH